jgi:integrase
MKGPDAMEEKKATFERHATDYPGVYFRWGTHRGTGKREKIYYIAYHRNGKKIEEKVGREKANGMTPLKASKIRAEKVDGAPSRKEQREAVAAAKAASSSRWTLTRLWDDYKATRYGDSPPLTEKANWKNHLSLVFGERTPGELSTLDVERLKSSLAKKGKKPGTVAKVTELLRRLINWGVEREYYPAPAVRVKLPRCPLDREPEFLSDAELHRLLAVLDAYEDAAVANIVRVALLTGMRRSEILRLAWDHVDLERGYLRITQSKGGQDTSIPLSDTARAVLKAIPRTPDPNDPEKELPLVFPGRFLQETVDGKETKVAKQRADVNRHAKKIKAAAGLPKTFRLFHGARHHFASTLASGGVDLYTVGRLLTHKSPQMTKRYSHLSDGALRTAADLAGRIIEHAGQDAEGVKAGVTNE